MKISEIKVEYCYHSGDDLQVVNAARVSFHKQSDWDRNLNGEYFYNLDNGQERLLSVKDTKLINYLAKHNHWTPFAHNSITLRIKAPLFVARQAGKHQVGLVWNEVSRRYVDEEPEFWFPKEWRGKSINAKQGSSGVVNLLNAATSYMFPETLVEFALSTYNGMLADGVAPELARIVLPQNMMTEWIWTGSLVAFSRVCKLRLDPHSQKEIQELARAIAGLVEPLFPISWKALMEN